MTTPVTSDGRPSIAVVYTSEGAAARAGQLAARLQTDAKPALPAEPLRHPTRGKTPPDQAQPRLVVDPTNTTLEWGPHPPTRLQLTFISGKNRYRAENSQRRDETLARAVGIGKRLAQNELAHYCVLDVTSGLGRDAWALASLGCCVIMMERCDWLQWMQRDALLQALEHPATHACAQRVTLVHANAIDWLRLLHKMQPGHTPSINAIYLDPMYPARAKSAAVKKDMQALQQLIGKDEDGAELLTQALLAAASSGIERVVVKRPRSAKPLENQTGVAVHHTHESRKTRYDVYLTGSR